MDPEKPTQPEPDASLASGHLAAESAPTPGTQHLLATDLRYKSTRSDEDEDIILVPQPSSDPDDPLNWSPKRKLLNTICHSIYTLFNGIALSNLYSVEVPLSEATGIPLSALNAGTGYFFLLAGWGLLFWQPVALQYGKRPVYISSLLLLLAMSLWSPYVRSDGAWYARCVLIGFFASPIEALPELSVTDLYFAHQRGTYMGLYAFTLVGSNFLAPLIFGFVNDSQGFKWVFYWSAIFCGAGSLFLFLFLEETNYDRGSNVQARNKDQSMTLREYKNNPKVTTKSYFRKLSLKPQTRPNHHLLSSFFLQLRFLLWPIPVYAGFAYGSTLIWFNVLNATSSLVLSSSPYNFSTSIVGLAYVAPLIGTLLGYLVTGRLSDLLVLRLARRNRGIMEPEQRLWIFAASTVLVPTALLVWGVGSVHGVHWFGLLFAMGLFGFVNTCGASLAVNYLVDCYREMSGYALTAVILVRNTMSFAIGYGITPWIDNLGRQNAFISAACIGVAITLHFLFIIWFGKRLRERSKDKYWKLVKQTEENGMLHS